MSSPSSDSARMEVVQCERDIQSIKAALRQVSSADSNQPNSLKVILKKIEGSGSENLNTDDVEVSLQLSAPVEEATISKIQSEGEEAGISEASFEGVETSMATLTVTLKSKEGGKVLGTSEAYDMSSVCSLGGDAMKPKDEYVTELPIAIVASPGEEAAFITEEADKPSKEDEGGETEKPAETEEEGADKKEEEGDKKEEEEETTTKEATETKDEIKKEEASTTTSVVVKPLATVTFKMVFKPSAKDQKEELYELLNKASLRRSQALERHRGSPTTTTTTTTTTTVSSSGGSAKPAVKPGFLNKKSPAKKKEPEKKTNKLMQFYEKYLGPKSLTRVIVPLAKNYVIFFGAVILFHFKGQELALPAPV